LIYGAVILGGPFLYLYGMKHIVYGLIIAFLLIMLFRSECGKPKVEIVKVDGKKYEVIKQKIDTQYVRYNVKGRTDTLIEDTTIYVEVPVIDTTAMRKYVEEYYAKKVFNDTIKLDYGKIYIQDTVSTNKIVSRLWNADLLMPTITDTKIVKELPKNELYFGARVDLQKNGTFVGIGPSLLLKTKRNRIYGVGVNLVGGQPIYNVQLNIKL